MKHLLAFLLIFSFVGIGCTSEQIVTEEESLEQELEVLVEGEEAVKAQDEEILVQNEGQVYVQFIQNVHDWVYPENSITTIHRVIDLHEEYELPVELHLTDAVIHKYLELDPDLVERLRTSAFVSISYHIRPPHPIYNGFDLAGLSDMSSEEIYETLLAYEEHELDLETGQYTDELGGYQFLKDTIGYAPRTVGQTTGRYGKEYSRVFEEKGALFTVLHEEGSELQDTVHGLNKRPEDQEVKLYEYPLAGYDIEALFEEWTQDFDGEKDFYVNLKFHENNYYLTNTPFSPIYWEDWNSGRQNPNGVPFDLTASFDELRYKSKKIQEEKWTTYEQALEYVANNSDWLTAVNAANLEQMLEK